MAETETDLRLERESNELYRLLNTGEGLDGIARLAESFLDRAVDILDAGYTMLAVSPMMREMPFGIEEEGGGTFLSVNEVESLRRLRIENQIYQTNRAFFVQTEDHPDTNWIFCAIRIQHVMSGYVAVCLPGDAEGTDHELKLTSVVADVCAIEMQKHDYFDRRAGLQYETFLSDLLEGRFNSPGMVESRFKMLNRHLGKYFCLAVLYSVAPHNSEIFNERQVSNLRKKYPGSLSLVYRNNIVLLLNQDEPIFLKDELVAPLEEFAVHNQLKVSLSQPFSDILKINIFYEQAVHTLELAAVNNQDKHLYFSTRALPDYLFSKCSYEELETGIHYHIFRLQDNDREYHTEFIATLRAYFKNGRNATRAAEELHIHRSTFFYRMKKMEELLGVSLDDSERLFLYELSLRI
ncbi:MAG: helix-turn-helix domain-containing protein, partial [Clostridiales bacterium]|nr:helix-turn-helix domain-containing protein [Clostridiales bacterium]